MSHSVTEEAVLVNKNGKIECIAHAAPATIKLAE